MTTQAQTTLVPFAAAHVSEVPWMLRMKKRCMSIGISHLLIDRPRDAAICARKAIHLKPEVSQSHFVLLAALATVGQTDDLAGALADCLAHCPDASVDAVGQLPFRSPAHRERFVLGVRPAGLPESPGNSVF